MDEGEDANGYPCVESSSFIFKRMLSVIGFNDLWGVNLVSWFPGIVRFWVSSPLDEVLESSSPASMSMINHSFYLIFLFAFDKVRGRPRIVGPMRVGFVIRGQK